MYNSSHFPVVIPFAWLPSVEGRDAKSARRLKGTNDIEVVADEDMVRPVDADIVSLILSVNSGTRQIIAANKKNWIVRSPSQADCSSRRSPAT
jgi:hypothetical protein